MDIYRDIGAVTKVVQGVPTVQVAGTLNGATIDRMAAGTQQGYLSCVLWGGCGAATGSPSAQTYDCKLQDSPDGSTWADFTDAAGNGALTQITADDTSGTENVNLEAADRYIRVVQTVGFTGGSTPDIPICAGVELGGALEVPTV